uniref:Uncharacterized protein n=1 Tax=Meloidogyne javanica TaxID=6303 RepID=A0A915LI28_MELJA
MSQANDDQNSQQTFKTPSTPTNENILFSDVLQQQHLQQVFSQLQQQFLSNFQETNVSSIIESGSQQQQQTSFFTPENASAGQTLALFAAAVNGQNAESLLKQQQVSSIYSMFPTTTTSSEFLNSFSQQDLTNMLLMPGLFANSNASQFLQKQFEEQIANNNQNLAENSSLISSSPQMSDGSGDKMYKTESNEAEENGNLLRII